MGNSNDVPLVPTSCATDTSKGTISIRVPQVVKGAKSKRSDPLEKMKGKKKKSAKNKGITDPVNFSHPTSKFYFYYNLFILYD